MGSENHKKTQEENGFISLIFNILIPVLLLTKGDKWIENPAIVLSIALAFPVLYFVWDYINRKKFNFISILGFVSILLTGGVGLFQLPRFWFIVKEAAIPALIGIGVLISAITSKPLVRLMVFNPNIFNLDLIQERLNEKGTSKQLDKLLRTSTLFLAFSFFISSLLNYLLASYIIQTEPSIDPVKFNAEVGAMTGWSYLIIALPSMVIMFAILFHLARGIKKLTGLNFEESLASHLKKTGNDSR